MKNLRLHLIPFFIFVFFAGNISAQTIEKSDEATGDSTYLPPLKIIADPSSFGPYFINTNHTNVYFVTDFPENTSKVIMKYTDTEGEQLGESKIEEGSNITVLEWTVEAEDVGFVLSSHLNIEVHYKTDSVAIYDIPYMVYPDTVKFFATAGWGPFFTNDYPLADGWQPVPEVTNTFSVYNLPPQTDTIQFQILRADSTVVDSLWVYASQDEYLDSVVFANLRMDLMPLSTEYLRTSIWCDGGPENGLNFYNKLKIVPQKPKLISKSDGLTLIDSIGVFVENEFTGQALLIDSAKYVEITNGPGSWDLDNNLNVIYRGPYCFDLFQRDFSIETWLEFDLDKVHDITYNGTSIMSVDSVWEFSFISYGSIVWFTLRSLITENNNEILTAKIPYEDLATADWHHFAITSYYSGSGYPQMHFYFDGNKWGNTIFHGDNYQYIREYFDYYGPMGTQSLFLGLNPDLYPPGASYITAMDEVRLWEGVLSEEEVKNNFRRKVLQKDWLVGYWNFDDMRNHLGYVSDLSYNNNRGQLKNGATFIPQYPLIQTTPDTIIYLSSNTSADSIIYSFIDRNNHSVIGHTNEMHNGGDTLMFDVSILPDNISKLSIREFSPGCPDSGFLHEYHLEGLAPIPIATPLYNWNTFYYCSEFGELYNSIVVSGLPEKTTKVELGLQKGDEFFNVDTLTQNSNPYRHSLSLNGTDNYIETSLNTNSTEKLTMSFWFKTNTTKGGKIIGFTDSKNGITSGKHDREIIMEKDGSLRFYLESEHSNHTLYAVNKYNDGEWHGVTVKVDQDIKLFVDSSLVDYMSLDETVETYSGYWVIGRNNTTKINKLTSVAEFFQGSICEVAIYDKITNAASVLAGNESPKYYYKFDDGKGTEVQDYSESNNTGELKGSAQEWFVANTISYVTWNHNILDKPPGTYDFFARVFYDDGPAEGALYLLGRNKIIEPFPGHNFTYNMRNGFGYFNEGTTLTNWLDFWINYTNSDSADWKNNFMKLQFFTLDHELINHQIFTYTDTYNEGAMLIDMGDAPPGSYLSLEVGYHTDDNSEYVTDQFSFSLYINPMLAPIVSGNFGPFNQAIAPGSMEQMNTFIVTTEILSDLNKVKAVFYDKDNKKIGETDAQQMSDTVWHITYDMAKLSPPTSKLSIEYYLGTNTHPALVQGPFSITIHKTRPDWFDFIADTSFHDVQQTGDEVTFSIITPFEESYLINNSESVHIPTWVPLIGETDAKMESPTGEAYLKYVISDSELELNEPPEFFQKVFNLGAGTAETLRFGFNYQQDNTYSLDDNNNLLATQNFSMGGSANSAFKELENIAKKVKEIIEAAKVADPETIIVSPSFSLTFSGSFEYAARQHLMIDSISGKWGSYGNLKVDANPEHVDAFKNSASYKFYSGALGTEFSIGAELLEGLVAGYFGVDGRFVLGFGHSYTTIPFHSTRPLKSFEFQTYGRFYLTALWGWYEKTLWGPKLFSSSKIWGDDMRDCFPPLSKKASSTNGINANSSWPELSGEINPVNKFSKMPMPVPEPKIVSASGHNLFTWVERGKSYGERKLEARYFNNNEGKFSDKFTIELNKHALNNPISDGIDNNLSFFCWAQTRFDNKSILKVKPLDAIEDFVKAQDIWYAIYDRENDSIILKDFIVDDIKSLVSGRAEANPVVAVISDTRVIIVWQVADFDVHKSELWYILLEKLGDDWIANSPEVLAEIDGIATKLEIASTGEDKAVITWLNTSKSDSVYNKVMYSLFNGDEWTPPHTLLNEENNFYNYLSLNFKNGMGGLLACAFVQDTAYNRYEKLLFMPWDTEGNQWNLFDPLILMVDSVNHLQLPQMTIKDDGIAVIALKVEEMKIKNEMERISQVDLLIGNLNNPNVDWVHIEANEIVCDTTKQIADLQLNFAKNDTMFILTNEYPMSATNMSFEPINGIMFGDPYMNLVLRSFTIDEEGNISDVDENDFFTDLPEYPDNTSGIKLYQNFPNPCAEQTTITFDIPESLSVKLELFNISGIKVATLIEHQLAAGRYQQQLNTALLKNGIYIYRLTAGKTVLSLRMMVGN